LFELWAWQHLFQVIAVLFAVNPEKSRSKTNHCTFPESHKKQPLLQRQFNALNSHFIIFCLYVWSPDLDQLQYCSICRNVENISNNAILIFLKFQFITQLYCNKEF